MRSPKVWAGIIASALFIGLLLRQVDLGEMRAHISEVRTGWPWLVAAMGIVMLALGVRGWRWRVILDRSARISTREALSLLIIGYAANNVLPMRTGELVRAQLLYQRAGVSRLATLGTIIVERIFDVLVLALFLTGTVVFAGGIDERVRVFSLLITTGAAGAAGVVALLTVWPRAAELCVAMLRVVPAGVRPRMQVLLGNFLVGLGSLHGGRVWLAVAGSSVLTWALEAAAFWLVGQAFALPITPVLYLAVCAAATLAVAAPSTAGGVGPFEVSASALLVVFGVPASHAAAYALVLHVTLIVPVVVLGVVLLWRQHLRFGSMWRAAQVPTGVSE